MSESYVLWPRWTDHGSEELFGQRKGLQLRAENLIVSDLTTLLQLIPADLSFLLYVCKWLGLNDSGWHHREHLISRGVLLGTTRADFLSQGGLPCLASCVYAEAYRQSAFHSC